MAFRRLLSLSSLRAPLFAVGRGNLNPRAVHYSEFVIASSQTPRNDSVGHEHLKGMSLIEAVLYVAFLSGIAVTVSVLFMYISTTYQRARAEREVISNARLMLETISKTVSSASEVYMPTSRFNTDAGQVSLVTVQNPPPFHTAKYIDVWADSGVLLMKEEGRATSTLSAASVRVSQFRVERIYQAMGREAVRITLGVSFANTRFPSSITLNTTAALRGNY